VLRFAAGLIFYNELKGLQRLIPTLQHMEKIYAIDGRFPEYPGNSDLSNDGSREFLKSFSNVVLIDAPKVQEVEKRNIYLRSAEADDIDVLLVIDADEYIVEADWAKFHSQCLTKMSLPGLYRVRGWNAGTFDPWPRLVHPPKDFEYYLIHYAFRHRPTGVYENAGHFARLGIEGIKIMHDDAMRSKEQAASSAKYQNWLVKYENYKLETQQAQDRKAGVIPY
jgi:hypothetical protein